MLITDPPLSQELSFKYNDQIWCVPAMAMYKTSLELPSWVGPAGMIICYIFDIICMYLLKDLGLCSVVISSAKLVLLQLWNRAKTTYVSEKKYVVEDTVKTTLPADSKFKNEEHLLL